MTPQAATVVVDHALVQNYVEASEVGDRSDKILLDQLRAGYPGAFEQLVAKQASRLINLAYRLVGNRAEAEEIAQEGFLRLHRSLDSFRGDCSLSSYLYRIVSRLAIDHLRREKLRRKLFFFRRQEDDVDPVDMAADTGASPRDNLQSKETGKRLLAALDLLSARQRAVFVLRHQEGLPLKEIAATLGLEEGTVKTHLHRAVRALRTELKDLQEDRS
ncbi:MAG: RNA polymerase sigma factor [Desulfuromonadaceae bacterium]|nr:RNA polymerase sigma factor [Desulfuromonadaceae bacterium]